MGHLHRLKGHPFQLKGLLRLPQLLPPTLAPTRETEPQGMILLGPVMGAMTPAQTRNRPLVALRQ